jgi:SNF2 family DNA or RNA helicase
LIKWGITTEAEITCIEGQGYKKAKAAADMQRFVIVNYDSIRCRADKQTKEETNEILIALLNVDWDVIVADEAHRIKNREAQQSVAMQKLKAKSKYRCALTGTPVQNRPNDLWHILNWLNDYYSGKSYWNFVEAFCEVENNGYGLNIVGLTAVEADQRRLNHLLQHYMIRNEKKTVLKDLPGKIAQTIDILMSAKQANLYKQDQKEILLALEDDEEIMIANALTRLLRLQQVTSNPEMFGLDENPKFDAAMELLEGTDNKVVFFSRFNETIKAFEKRLQKANIKYVKITGVVTSSRQDIVDQFQQDDSVRVFLGTIKAAGEGLTLTAADTVVFFDREWSPAMNDQATDRVHRIGQTKGVHVVDLKIEGTIDTWVEDVLNKKIMDIKKLIV